MVIWDEETLKGAIIDPGCYWPEERHALKDFIDKSNINIERILLTHGHIDHVLGAAWAQKQFAVPTSIHHEDLETLTSVKVYASNYGVHNYEPVEIDSYLLEGQKITLGASELKVLFTPGHSRGHISFLDEIGGQLFSGDVLFLKSIGRTDLPGGDFKTLESTILSVLYALPDTTVVFPGHGPKTSIGFEKHNNPFVAL